MTGRRGDRKPKFIIYNVSEKGWFVDMKVVIAVGMLQVVLLLVLIVTINRTVPSTSTVPKDDLSQVSSQDSILVPVAAETRIRQIFREELVQFSAAGSHGSAAQTKSGCCQNSFRQ